MPNRGTAGDYFFFHHTEGDTMTVLDSDQMDIAVATVAVHAFAAANLESMMPRGESEHMQLAPWPSLHPLITAVVAGSAGPRAGGGGHEHPTHD